MRIKGLICGISLLLACSLSFGCINQESVNQTEGDKGNTFTDSLGQTIQMKTPKRVVALMGSFAEIWLESGGTLVGVTDDAFDKRGVQPEKDTITVGTYNRPNLETILALGPDLVLLSSETKEHVALKKPLEQAGIQTVFFRVTDFNDYLNMLKICTDITNRSDLYDKNGKEVESQIQQIITERKKIEESPSVLFLITYSGGAKVEDSKTMTGKMLKDLGCRNIADQNVSLLKEFNMESILEENPDFIFVIPMGNDEERTRKNLVESIEKNPAWNGLTAVKKNRYILLPKEMFLYKPNARWGDSYEYLKEILDRKQ
ncbi:ABC transporter substrate-binding protein [Clostridium sp. E02]|uniref:ABC transporter substrate-binding protein n=1 Tax=Clostridium sp. E02 TaxID=2487134 RepID=UPI000F53E0EB|nr:ABC transporter substrate-binding protein [Clostridium sp. E02]